MNQSLTNIGKIFLFVLAGFISVQALGQTEHKLLAGDGASNDAYGVDVAIAGDVAIVGANNDNNSAVSGGGAYIYRFNGTNWVEEQKLISSDISDNDNFGISTAISGNVAIVGANHDDDNGTSSGSVYVFRYNGSNWIEEQKLTAADAAVEDEFGWTLALEDTVAVIGAYRNDDNASNSGSVYIFHYDGATWNQAQKVNAPGASVDDFFGYSVAISGDACIIGAYLDDDNGTNSGSAFVYRYNGSTWAFEEKLTASDGINGDSFGFDVAIYNDVLICGAFGNNNAGSAAGTCYVYRFNGSNWIEEQKLNASDATADDWFGFSVGISDQTIIVGAFHDDDFGAETGGTYIFRHTGTSWFEEFKILASDADLGDEFGAKVAISNYTTIVGAINNDDNGSNSGSAYIYPLCTYTPEQEVCLATVTANSQNNTIVWENPFTTFIDSIRIYRDDNSTDVYLGSVDYNSPSEFTDNSSSTIPSWASYDYKLTTINFCGEESPFGALHKTIHLIASPAGNNVELNWDQAEGFTFQYYRVWRDSTGTGDFEVIAATLNNEFTFTDNNPPSTSTLEYMIEVERGSTCNSGQNGFSSVFSNKSNPYLTAIEDETANAPLVNVYPNPTTSQLTVEFKTLIKKANVVVTDILGNVISQSTIAKARSISLDLSGHANGHYFLSIYTKDQVFQKKIILQH
jgi:hypothetical protein